MVIDVIVEPKESWWKRWLKSVKAWWSGAN